MKLTQPNRSIDQLKANMFFSGILALIIIILWIGISVYNAYINQKPDTSIQSLLTPLNPTLDLETLQQFKNSRLTPSDSFTITIVTTEGNVETKKLLNPFAKTPNVVNIGSPSAAPISSNEQP